jgi:hypothetical protein
MEWTGGAEGMRDLLSDCTCPLDFFLLFWPVDILRTIVQMTNLYAASRYDDGSIRGSHRWYRLTISKLLSFFGVLMLMALKKVPFVRLHWSRKYSDLFRTPVIRNAMSRNRFEDILKCIHLVDNKEVCTDNLILATTR